LAPTLLHRATKWDETVYRVSDYQLPGATVTTTGAIVGFDRLGAQCPRCGRAAWFQFDPPISKEDILKAPRQAHCGGCGGSVHFYTVKQPSTKSRNWLWAHPSPEALHATNEAVADALGVLHPALRQAYTDAAGSLRDGRWSAAVSEARRTLEGLVKHLLKDRGATTSDRLQQLIEKLASTVDLTRPLMDTAHTVRQGGNVGAHFDTEILADEPLANELLALVEAFVEYLLLLPSRVASLRDHLDGAAPSADESDAESEMDPA
jgi:hypothetical protein